MIERNEPAQAVGLLKPTKLGFDQDTSFIDNLENSIMNNNSIVNGYDHFTTSFPKETPPLDKDIIVGFAQANGVKDPTFTGAVNYIRGDGAESIPPDIKKIMEDSNLWGKNTDEDFMNSIEETDPLFLSKLQENGLDPYLMNKKQIEKQYLLWNREQRPTSFTTDLLSEAVDPINWIPAARAGVKVLSKVAPALSPIKSRFASVSVEATSTAYAQSKLMVANKGFMSEQEKDNQVAVTTLFTAAMVGGISTAGLIGTKAIIKVDGFSKAKSQSTQGKDSKSYVDNPCIPK
jgi:hypothetical protein